MKLAIVDLDGVIANNEARFAKAEEAKQAFRADVEKHFGTIDLSSEKDATNLYWRTVFDPELVTLDTLMDGAIDAMAELAFNGYDVILLTSRPESMRGATRRWLFEQDCPVDLPLLMKPPAFQYTKTVVWKAGTIQMLAALHGADEVLVIDDEGANLAELQKHDVSRMRLCSSLAEAIALPAPESDNPF